MHLYVFTVEPLPSHPHFYEVEDGWAHVYLRDDLAEGESVARAYLQTYHLKAKELEASRLILPEHHDLMPIEAREALRHHPIFSEIFAYETGGGPELPEGLFSGDTEGAGS